MIQNLQLLDEAENAFVTASADNILRYLLSSSEIIRHKSGDLTQWETGKCFNNNWNLNSLSKVFYPLE